MAEKPLDPTPVRPSLALRRIDLSYRRGRRRQPVLRSVDLQLDAGHLVGLVGESGCGKSTLGKVCVGLARPDGGQVLLGDGRDLLQVGRAAVRSLRPRLQMVFQDPYSAFNPRLRVGQSIDLNLCRLSPDVSATERQTVMEHAFDDVLLEPGHLRRYPDQLSGGQLQRAAIARALLARPDVLVADEIVSALDLATQEVILERLVALTSAQRIAVLFISHDLGVIASTCERIAVMADGRIVETGRTGTVVTERRSATTQALFDAVPRLATVDGPESTDRGGWA